MKTFMHTIKEPRVAASFWQPAAAGEVQQWQSRGVEVAELRFDLWNMVSDADKDNPPCSISDVEVGILSYAGLQRIATARLCEEGGQWRDNEAARAAVLRTAAAHCEAVDVELAASIRPQIVEAAAANHCALILSRHNIHSADTLANMEEAMRRAFDAGADIYKNASMVKTPDDLRVLKDFLQKWAGQYPLIVTGMGSGDIAKQARRELPMHGSRLAFAAVVGKSAPGQLSLEETKAAVDAAKKSAAKNRA